MLSLLIDKLKKYSTECKLELEDASFLLSFSGGIDSTVLASLLLEMRNTFKFKLGFAHFNHHAHNKSDKFEKFCLEYSHDNDVVFHQHELFFDSKSNFEACAREKRYTILNKIAVKHAYHFILTAHHQDDQLETVYMKKMDGADWISQIGIREKMGKLRRPFLDISKKEIKVYAKENNIAWIEDPTNSNISIRRNKIRHLQLPQALQIDSRLKESLLITAQKNVLKLKDTEQKLKNEQDKVIKYHSKNNIHINRKELQKYNLEELKLFTYNSIALLLNVKLNQQSGGLWKEFKKFINKSNTGSIFKIDTLTFIINRNVIDALYSYDNLKSLEKSRLCNNLVWYSGQFQTMSHTTIDRSYSKNKFIISHAIYQDGLYIRTWKHGDRMISATSKKHVSLSKLYINNKLSKYEKQTQPVVVDNNDRIFWIPGYLHGYINFNEKNNAKVIHWIKR